MVGGRPRLGWMDGVKVARKIGKWEALVHMYVTV